MSPKITPRARAQGRFVADRAIERPVYVSL
jgi:hypothetical protein